MTFHIAFLGTPGLPFAVQVSTYKQFGSSGTDQDIAGAVPLDLAVDGVAVSVTAWIAEGLGDLTISVTCGDLVRTESTRSPNTPISVTAMLPRSAYVSFRSKRRQRRTYGDRQG
jgi:hypothetical protein